MRTTNSISRRDLPGRALRRQAQSGAFQQSGGRRNDRARKRFWYGHREQAIAGVACGHADAGTTDARATITKLTAASPERRALAADLLQLFDECSGATRAAGARALGVGEGGLSHAPEAVQHGAAKAAGGRRRCGGAVGVGIRYGHSVESFCALRGSSPGIGPTAAGLQRAAPLGRLGKAAAS
jgi:hypothetical protein